MLRDIEHLSARLNKLEGFGDLDTYLTKIVKGKDIKVEVKPEAPKVEERKSGEKNGESANNGNSKVSEEKNDSEKRDEGKSEDPKPA